MPATANRTNSAATCFIFRWRINSLLFVRSRFPLSGGSSDGGGAVLGGARARLQTPQPVTRTSASGGIRLLPRRRTFLNKRLRTNCVRSPGVAKQALPRSWPTSVRRPRYIHELLFLADDAGVPRDQPPPALAPHPDVRVAAVDGLTRARGVALRHDRLPPHHDHRVAVNQHGLGLPHERG